MTPTRGTVPTSQLSTGTRDSVAKMRVARVHSAKRGTVPPRVLSTAGGFSYIEVLIAVAVLAVALVPAIEALNISGQSSALYSARVAQHHRLVARMETLLAASYSALAAEASTPGSPTASAVYSDPGGTASRRLVYITAYDGDNADADNDPFTGTDANLLWLRVEIENSVVGLEALTSP